MPATTINDPIDGETLVATAPLLQQTTDSSAWRERLNLFTGRALTDTALENEQIYRSSLLSMLGQSVSPGTVKGLALSLDSTGTLLTLTAGYGIMPTGQDVVLNSTLKTTIASLTVATPPVTPLLASYAPNALTSTESALTVGDWQKQAGSPFVGVILLQPVLAEVSGQLLDTSGLPQIVSGNLGASCAQDSTEYAFDDWQVADAVQLVCMPWPTGVTTLPLPALNPQTTLRNRLAYTIFEAESSLGPEDVLPWATLGLPVGLIAFDNTASWKTLFLDCSSVVRAGGLPRNGKRAVIPGQSAMQPVLSQAQLYQFSEQLSQLMAQGTNITNLAQYFPTLPPSGILPFKALDLTDLSKPGAPWLPPNWQLTGAPVRLEELESVLATGMSLAPLSAETSAPANSADLEPVELLVPLPDALYDPNILIVDTVPPVFQQELDAATAARNLVLQKRATVQNEVNALFLAIGPNSPNANLVDPNAGLTADEIAGSSPPYSPTPTETFGTALQSTWLPSTAYTAGQLVIDSNGNFQVVRTAGISGAQTPVWATGVTQSTTDGAVTWLNNGSWNWQPQTAYVVGQFVIDPNGHRQNVTVAGTSAAAAPVWNSSTGQNSAEGGLTWTNAGPITWQAATQYAAGSIILDSNGNFQVTVTAGKSGTTAPSWSSIPGTITIEVTAPNTVAAPSWQNADTGRIYQSTDILQLRAQAPAAGTFTDANGKQISRSLLSDSDLAMLASGGNGLQALITSLNSRINSANDLLDAGFLTVQTDIYRYRQNVLGSVAASTLATSPILANIATGNTASATAANLQGYLSTILPAPRAATGAPVTALVELPARNVQATDVQTTSYQAFASPSRAEAEVFSPTLQSSASAAPAASVAPSLRTEAVMARVVNTGASAIDGAIVAKPVANTAVETALARTVGAINLKSSLTANINFTSPAQIIVPGKTVTATPADITSQSPLPGAQLNLRTLTVGERLQQSPSQEALFYSISNRLNLLQSLQQLATDLNLYVDDLSILVDDPPAPPASPPAVPPPVPTKPFPFYLFYNDLKVPLPLQVPLLPQAAIQQPYIATDSSEASLFSAGIRVLEQHTMLLRAIEGRVQQYADFVTQCQTALSNIQNDIQQGQSCLTQLNNDLLQARQNVAFTAALLSDEIALVDKTNAQRKQILSTQVQIVAYTRARTLEATDTTPSRQLLPANVTSPVPACLQQTVSIPPELNEIIGQLREVPVNWIPAAAALVQNLQRPVLLQQLALDLQSRASLLVRSADLPSSAQGKPGVYASAIARVYSTNQAVTRSLQMQRVSFNPSSLTSMSWSMQVYNLQNYAALNDLISSQSASTDVSNAVARVIQQISSVATCLYTQASSADPIYRLGWANYLTASGESVALSSLAILPGWNGLNYMDRQQMQLVVDWLFQQIDTTNAQASAFMSDIVRTAILLASDVPLDQIIPGAVIQRVQPTIGGLVMLNLSSDRIATGMYVNLYSAGNLAARAVVSDLDSSTVSATVTDVYSPGTYLNASDIAHFTAQPPLAVAMRSVFA